MQGDPEPRRWWHFKLGEVTQRLRRVRGEGRRLMAIINTALLHQKESRRDDIIIEIGLHQHEPERRRCDISIFGIDRLIVFFYHKVREEGTEVTEGFR